MTEAPLIDIAVNLTNKAFRADLDDVLERAWKAGLQAILITGVSENGSIRAAELTERDPKRLFATAGVHPHDAAAFSADTVTVLQELAAQPNIVAMGETGLDFNRDFSPRPDQERAFERQLQLACELELPVLLHQRDAHERFLPILRAYRDELPGAVVHCFTGTREELWDYLDLDLYVGITGWICDERRGLELQKIVVDIPESRLLLETDAPFLVPRTLRPKPSAGRNEPALLPEVLRQVAHCRGADPADLATATTANARALFRLPE